MTDAPPLNTLGGATGELRLPRPPGVFRRWLADRPRMVDGTIVVVYLLGCALMVTIELLTQQFAEGFVEIDPEGAAQITAIGLYLQWPWGFVRALIIAAVALALAYRRRYPLTGLLVIGALAIFDQGMLAAPNAVALVFLLYAVPVYRSVRAGWVGYGLVVGFNALTLMLTRSNGGALGPAATVFAMGPLSWQEALMLSLANAVWLLAVLMIAINLGNRRRYVDALIDRAHQLAREREQQAQLAAAAERSRIAREMHDIVAHSLSVVVTLSEAASVAVESQPLAAKRASERAAETGRAALVEMRRLLGVLNDDGVSGVGGVGGVGGVSTGASAGLGAHDTGAASHSTAMLSPQPGTAELPQLVQVFYEAGLRVALTEQGVAAGDAMQQLAVYRIVQEALTNALRYAGRGTDVRVTIEHTAAETRIEVVDGGLVQTGVAATDHTSSSAIDAPAAPTVPLPGTGRGLAGAAERAHIFGGRLEAGPYAEGWRVAAVVPTGADYPAAASAAGAPAGSAAAPAAVPSAAAPSAAVPSAAVRSSTAADPHKRK